MMNMTHVSHASMPMPLPLPLPVPIINGDSDNDDDEEGALTLENPDIRGSDDDEQEDPKDYCKGGYHPITIGSVFNQRYHVIRKLGWGNEFCLIDLFLSPLPFVLQVISRRFGYVGIEKNRDSLR